MERMLGALCIGLTLIVSGCSSSSSGSAGAGDSGIATDGGGADAVVVFNDQDGDKVDDSVDNCPEVANRDQQDFDGDGLGDPCDPDPPAQTCGDTEVASARLAPNVLVVLDRSRSMDSNNKWQNATSALDTLSDHLADQLRLGLALFSGSGGQCGAPDLMLAVGNNSASAFQASYAHADPTGYTPMRRALELPRTQKWLDDPNDPDDARRTKNVMLVTDGQPNCAVGHEDEANYSDLQATLDEAQKLAALGVKVYVVGFGNGVDPAALNAIAEKGGTDNAADPNNRYFQANDAQALQAALLAIGAQVGSCTLQLDGRPGDPSRIYVLSNDNPLTRDDPDGFSYDASSNTIELKGSACDAVKQAPAPTLRVIFGCPLDGSLPVIK